MNKKITTSYFSNGFILPFKGVDLRLETYTEDDQKYITYKNNNEELNEWPLKIENEMVEEFLIEKGLTIKIIVKDYSDNSVLYSETIRQLEGKDGGEPDTEWKPSETDLKEYKGRQGFQGPSVVGPPGKGIQGIKGPPFYSNVRMLNNQSVTIPVGISEIFITASAGGGSAANHANSFYIYDVYDANASTNQDFALPLYYKDTEDSTTIKQSKNTVKFKQRKFVAIHLLPGSGFAGQSVYRKKIKIADPTVEHTLLCFIGGGGKLKTDLTDRNGSDGENTKVYLDDKLILELRGGLGGKQQMPMLSADKPFLAVDDPRFNENQGFKRNTLYWKITNSTVDDYKGFDDRSYTPWTKMEYHVKSGALYDRKFMYAQNRFRKRSIQFYGGINITGGSTLNCFPLKNIKDLNGQSNIFTTVYARYSSKYSRTPDGIKSSIKTTNLLNFTGFGEGGDCYWAHETFDPTRFWNRNKGSNDVYIADKKEFIEMSNLLISNFEPAAVDGVSFEKGNFLEVDWNTYFYGLTSYIDTLRKDSTTPLLWNGPGFYWLENLLGNYVIPSRNNVDQQPGNGTDGCCMVEFGGIEEVTDK